MVLEAEPLEEEEARERAKIGFIGFLHPMFARQKISSVEAKQKNKCTSFPLQPALHGVGILGPPPQLNGV